MANEVCETLSPERKSALLNRLSLRVKDVMELTGYGKRKCYELMATCRNEFNGKAGVLTDAITPKSLCKACGTTLEEQIGLQDKQTEASK